jgi:3-oxoacyl-[acyl-carrier protein] reductase
MKRVALITGGSRGIGFGIAEQLAQNDFNLAINGIRSSNEVEDAIKKLNDFGNEVIYCQGNIAESRDRENILQQVTEYYGRLHVLVNNAGVAPKERKDILDTTEESFDDVVSTNLKGTYFLMQKAANWMIEQKKKDD